MYGTVCGLFVVLIAVSRTTANGTQFIDWGALNDAVPEMDDVRLKLVLYSRKFLNGTEDMAFLRKKLHTYVLIHGFNDNPNDSIMLPLLTNSYLQREKCNVVIVDWSEHAKGPWFISAAKNTLPVGKELAAWLDSSGLDMSQVTLVGFSMGAHVAGDAGQFARKRLAKIVALDPAHFLFESTPPEYRLDSSDAEIVEVLHTSGGFIGEKESLGTRDFFPNGGTHPQPGCSPDTTGTCSHRRAYYYYNEAIGRPDDNFRARRCPSYDHFLKHKCKENGKPVILHLVNNNFDKSFKGNFYFITNPQEPFLKRANSTVSAKGPFGFGR
ncbi:phosphatidylcholine 1-acylhydrolase activity [Nesidiocoris tenuis]|uniref:Phosphatidylcholine 1-acylhydrolase activity n=1 Tax=Nesidiocoris tenuis TaxID=355587 RepID=A0ABN7BCG3_9HEMI|nr:phosphatidylcholine 1-acylhydrolase activity [Nesidiocoris tenuis]